MRERGASEGNLDRDRAELPMDDSVGGDTDGEACAPQ